MILYHMIDRSALAGARNPNQAVKEDSPFLQSNAGCCGLDSESPHEQRRVSHSILGGGGAIDVRALSLLRQCMYDVESATAG